LRTFQALKLLNHKSQNANTKWFDKPFDRLTVLSPSTLLRTVSLSNGNVEGLTTLSQVEGQITMTQIQNPKQVLVIEN